MNTPNQLQNRFTNFRFTWETHPLFPEAAQFLLDCDATEAYILKRWNEAIYGDKKLEPTQLKDIIADAKGMRELRRKMGAAQPTLPSLPSLIAVNRAKRLINSGAADDALMLLAGAESLQSGDLGLLIPQAVNTPKQTTDQAVSAKHTTPPTSPPATSKWPPKWLTLPITSAIATFLIALGVLVGWGVSAVSTGNIAAANQTATATAQTATASAEAATASAAQVATANAQATLTAQAATASAAQAATASAEAATASAAQTVTTAETTTTAETATTAEITTTAAQPSPTPPTVYLHTLSLTNNTLALPADFTLPTGVALPITGMMTIDGVPVEVELKADGSNPSVRTFTLVQGQYEKLQDMFVTQPTLPLPITFTESEFTINLVAEEQTVKGLPIIEGDQLKWDKYPSQIEENYETYLYITVDENQNKTITQDNGRVIAVLYANLPPKVDGTNLVQKNNVPTQVKQNDPIRILATQTVGQGNSAVTYYRIRTQDGVVGWLPAVFVDGVEAGEGTQTPTVEVTPTPR